MNAQEVHQIVRHKRLPHPTKEVKLVETHISWVLLGDTHVYKLKKPLKLSFLDFSTLENRKYYSHLEVELNQRLAPEMYLGVLAVTQQGEQIYIGGEGEVVDYAVCMRRMDEGRQMDLLIAKGAVSESDIKSLAEVLAQFHMKANKAEESESWRELFEEFEDISSVLPFLKSVLADQSEFWMEEILKGTYRFLEGKRQRIEDRKAQGFVIEGHGDLHCRNIFLLDPPVIFDCIEFNEDFRTLDMLNEAAFLCMDLERFGRPDLASTFIQHYNGITGVIKDESDRQLFIYYKMYRANVRLKVHCIHFMEGLDTEEERHAELEIIAQYLSLLKSYYTRLKGQGA